MPACIMHIDMDAFFASIEQLDDPELRGKPVIVGWASERGVVAAASYEARRFGVRSAMAMVTARHLCPEGIVVPGRRARYMEFSRRIVEALAEFSPLVEQASIDEAYLDATGLEHLFGPPPVMAMALKARIQEVTGGLTCSVGVAPVKFLAKIVSDIKKPNGLFILTPGEVDAFLLRLPLGKIPGVGKQTLAQLNRLGIATAGDVRRYPKEFWEERFGKAGASIYRKAHGLGSATVTPWRPPKSESAENTFAADTLDQDILKSWLMRQAERVGASLRRHGLAGRTITLKIKYADFRQITRSKSLAEPTDSTRAIFEEACRLLDALHFADKVRLIGLGVSNFDGGSRQLPLPLGDAEIRDADARKRLDQAMDAVRERFGKNSIQRGRALETKKITAH